MKNVFQIIIALFLVQTVYSQQPITLYLNANKIAVDSKRNVINATINSADINYFNSFVSINPSTGTVVKKINLGNNPSDFVYTFDSNFVYIAFLDTPKIVKFDLNKYKIVQTILIDYDTVRAYQPYPGSLAVISKDDSIVITTKVSHTFSSSSMGVIAFKNGKKMPKEISYIASIDELISTTSDTLFGHETTGSYYEFSKIKFEKDSGISVIESIGYMNLRGVKFGNGLLYDNFGIVLNPIEIEQVGSFNVRGKYNYDIFASTPDFTKNKFFTFTIDDSYSKSSLNFYSYDMSTYTKIDEYILPFSTLTQYNSPAALQLSRFGDEGLVASISDDFASYKQNYSKSIIIFNNLPLIKSTKINDTTGLTKVFALDTIFVTQTKIDTIHYYKYKQNIVYDDTVALMLTDTLVMIYKDTLDTITNGKANVAFSQINIFPNPCTKILNLDFDDYILDKKPLLQITDMLGKVVYETTISTKYLKVDVSQYKRGTYNIVLINTKNHSMSSLKVIVK